MKVIDVHPEELLDRELRGTLTVDQRALLDAHLAHCQVCRLERMMRADFAAEAEQHSEASLAGFVLGAMQQASQQAAQPTEPVRARGGRRLGALAVAACLLLGTGAAFARTGWAERAYLEAASWVGMAHSAPQQTPTKRAAPRPSRQEAAAELPKPSAAAVVDTPVVARAAPVTEPARVVKSAPTQRPERAAPVVRTRRAAKRRAVPTVHTETAPRLSAKERLAPTEAVSAPDSTAVAVSSSSSDGVEHSSAALDPSPAPTPQLSAAVLFEQANRARRSQRRSEAAQLYRELTQLFPSSAEAKLSEALVGRMWLDAGDALAAHERFEAYLRSGDRALREEAMAGNALSLEKLGRTAEAMRAYQALLSAFPRSSYAPLARRKLGQD